MKFKAIAILLIIIAATYCQNTVSPSISSFPLPNLTSQEQMDFLLRFQNEMKELNVTTQEQAEQFLVDHSLVIFGSNMDAGEKAGFEAAKLKYPILGNITPVTDSNDSITKMKSGKYPLIVLVGGPGQNWASKEAISLGWMNESEQFFSGFVIQYGKTAKGDLVVIVSDQKGFSNVNKEGVKYSPLNAFMEPQYVPVAATGISVLMLALISIVRTIFEFKALDIGRKGKKVGDNAIMVGPVNVKEVAAICGASFVLGISVSWQYFGPTTDFVFWTFVNTIICLFAAILHEVSHRSLAAAFGMKVEYRFWKSGSLLTLISSYLGNAFSVQGFLLEEIPEHTAKWKVALMRIIGPLMSAGTMIGFAIINLIFPHTVFQMVIATSALWAIAEVFPFNGLDGKDLKDWNIFIWLFTFCFVAAAYAVVTFVL